MRWIIKKTLYGDIRIIKKFAIYPVIINNEIALFETVYIKQQFYKKWENIEFVTKEDYENFLKK